MKKNAVTPEFLKKLDALLVKTRREIRRKEENKFAKDLRNALTYGMKPKNHAQKPQKRAVPVLKIREPQPGALTPAQQERLKARLQARLDQMMQ